jgi:hypothetical protein
MLLLLQNVTQILSTKAKMQIVSLLNQHLELSRVASRTIQLQKIPNRVKNITQWMITVILFPQD